MTLHVSAHVKAHVNNVNNLSPSTMSNASI